MRSGPTPYRTRRAARPVTGTFLIVLVEDAENLTNLSEMGAEFGLICCTPASEWVPTAIQEGPVSSARNL